MTTSAVSKKLTALLLTIIIVFSACVTSYAENGIQLNPDAYPAFADKSWGALYAHATLGGNSAQAWQRWGKDYTGINAKSGMRYFFLPNTADDKYVELYNNYDNPAVIDGVTIEPYTSAVVSYEDGAPLSASVNGKTYSFTIYKSDSEASVYVNDTRNSYVDASGVTQNTDLYSFLIKNKENSVKGSDCAIAAGSAVTDTTLKKIKGRGNTNWTETDKKPFNIQFNDAVTIGHTNSKKFSFVANAKDSTLLRNTIMYNLANDVGSPYAPDQSFVDFFVNGEYRGSFIACQKVDMGKSSLVSLKDNSDSRDEGFNFLVEVDVWNYKSDVYFQSDKGYYVVLKTPDLEDYDPSDESQAAKYNYIKNTYQQLENALYSGTLGDLEKICDLESLASQYLLQEFGKNCDGGYTSTFFTYNADEGKFYAAPLWDCDSDLGAVDCVRDGCTTSTCNYQGWVTRTATFRSDTRITTVNPLGQPFSMRGTTESGETFESIVKRQWTENFVPKIDILLGNSPATDGRLKCIDEYAQSIEKAAYNNYVMWGFMWYCARLNSGLNKTYSRDYSGELAYLKDWTKARAEWLDGQYNAKEPEPNTVYFENTLSWSDVYFYAWGDGNTPMTWPGEKAEFVETKDGTDIYKAVVPAALTKVIFNGGEGGAQTANVDITDSLSLCYPTTSTGRENYAYQPIYNVGYKNYTEPEKPTETEPITEPVTETATETATETVTATETATEAEPLAGDVNLDGRFNIKDATALRKHIAKLITLSNIQLRAAKITDREPTVKDATRLQEQLAGIVS